MVATGTGIIKLDATGFKSSVDTIKKGFGALDTSATKSMSTIKTKSNDATTSLGKVKSKANEAAGAIKATGASASALDNIKVKSAQAASGLTQTGAAAQLAGAKIKQMAADATAIGPVITTASASAVAGFGNVSRAATNAMNTVTQKSGEAANAIRQTGDAATGTGTKLQNLSVQVIGLGQAVTGAASAWAGYNEQVVALNKQIVAQEMLVVSVTRAEEDLAKIINDGSASIEEITRRTEDLNFMRQNAAIGIEEITTKEKTMQAQLVTLGFTMAQTGFFGITTLTTVLSKNQKAWIATRAQVLFTGNSLKVLGFNFKGAALAMKGATFSLAGFRAGIKATWLALGPIGLAVIGITIAMEVWQNNIGGVQEHIAELWEWLKKLMPMLLAIETVVKGIFPDEVAEQVDNTTESIVDYTAATEDALIAGEALTSNSAASKWAKYWADRATEINKAETALTGFNKEVGKLKSSGFSPAVIKAAISGDKSLDQIRADINKALILELNLMGLKGGNLITGERFDSPNVRGTPSLLAAGFNRFSQFTAFDELNQPTTPRSPFGVVGLNAPGTQVSGTSAGGFAGRPAGAFTRSSLTGRRGGGSPNRHQKQQALDALDAMFGGDRRAGLSLSELTGVNLTLQRFQVVNRGASGPVSFGFDDLRRRLAEANARVSLAGQINALNPVLGITARRPSSELAVILRNQQNAIAAFATELNLSQNEIIAFQQTQTGVTDIGNMLVFTRRTQRERVAATTV